MTEVSSRGRFRPFKKLPYFCEFFARVVRTFASLELVKRIHEVVSLHSREPSARVIRHRSHVSIRVIDKRLHTHTCILSFEGSFSGDDRWIPRLAWGGPTTRVSPRFRVRSRSITFDDSRFTDSRTPVKPSKSQIDRNSTVYPDLGGVHRFHEMEENR